MMEALTLQTFAAQTAGLGFLGAFADGRASVFSAYALHVPLTAVVAETPRIAALFQQMTDPSSGLADSRYRLVTTQVDHLFHLLVDGSPDATSLRLALLRMAHAKRVASNMIDRQIAAQVHITASRLVEGAFPTTNLIIKKMEENRDSVQQGLFVFSPIFNESFGMTIREELSRETGLDRGVVTGLELTVDHIKTKLKPWADFEKLRWWQPSWGLIKWHGTNEAGQLLRAVMAYIKEAEAATKEGKPAEISSKYLAAAAAAEEAYRLPPLDSNLMPHLQEDTLLIAIRLRWLAITATTLTGTDFSNFANSNLAKNEILFALNLERQNKKEVAARLYLDAAEKLGKIDSKEGRKLQKQALKKAEELAAEIVSPPADKKRRSI